jgi:hypothetical protein
MERSVGLDWLAGWPLFYFAHQILSAMISLILTFINSNSHTGALAYTDIEGGR